MVHKDIIVNFDDEFSSKKDWINVHLWLLYTDALEVRNTIYIFKVVDREWNRKVEDKEYIGYSCLRTTLFDALPYRIVLGLSKLFVRSDDYILIKTCNIISQMDEYKNCIEVKNVIEKINTCIKASDMIENIYILRDKFFAHLDRKSVISEYRIDASKAMKYLDVNELDKLIGLMGDLYCACTKEKITVNAEYPLDSDIIQMFFAKYN